MQLTNEQTKIVYSHYGINRLMTYNGSELAAIAYLKSTTGIVNHISVNHIKGDCYSPKGYSSTIDCK